MGGTRVLHPTDHPLGLTSAYKIRHGNLPVLPPLLNNRTSFTGEKRYDETERVWERHNSV